ncbi:MAG: PIN domain-containing protein [Candidatus ainarchaeum sp.]|nr:PIN domain-containing protein [Candidatus ainarchaeum sp.]
MKTYIVDTYAWIAYFERKGKISRLMDNNYLVTPSIVVAEFVRVSLRNGMNPEKISAMLSFMEKHSLIMGLDFEQAVKAAQVSEREALPVIDGIVYSYADANGIVLTGDDHFKGKECVEFVKEGE